MKASTKRNKKLTKSVNEQMLKVYTLFLVLAENLEATDKEEFNQLVSDSVAVCHNMIQVLSDQYEATYGQQKLAVLLEEVVATFNPTSDKEAING
jgi:hypothetical protein